MMIGCLGVGLRGQASSAGKEEKQNKTAGSEWSDVLLVEQPEPTISYRTGWVVYEESLTKGQFVGRGWNGAGFVNFYDGRINPAEHPMPEAFWLEIDGQSLASDWEWVGLEKMSSSSGNLHAVITLKHKLRPVTVKVHTKLDGTAVLTRWLEVINTGKHPAALAVACPWSGVMQKTNRWRSHLEARRCLCTRLAISAGRDGAKRGTFTGTRCLRRGIESTGDTDVTATGTPSSWFAIMPPASTSSVN